jgi:hypothetical protein
MLQAINTGGVKIFRPAEYEALRTAMYPSVRIMLDGLLFTGMRYIEAQRFQEHPEWWDGRSYISLPEGAAKKVKAEFKSRTIKLSELGCKSLPNFLKKENRLPSRSNWDWIIRKWCIKAGIEYEGPRTKKIAEMRVITKDPNTGQIMKDPVTGKRMIQRIGTKLRPIWSVNAKSTRKTWESWLATWYGVPSLTHIQLYQGHNAITQAKHYLGLGFYPEDKAAMQKYVEGWM